MCDEILRRGLKFEWIANTRADCVDYPLLKHMHRAGCRRIYYGWESGSQRMLDVLKKDLTPEAIIEAAKGDRARLTAEAADVLYHLLVMLAARDLTLGDVLDELERREGRSGLDEKAARKG